MRHHGVFWLAGHFDGFSSHILTVVSPPLTTNLPSVLKATLYTSAVCPLRVKRALPDRVSHTFTVSPLPLASSFPSALNDTLSTSLSCPLRVRNSFPVLASQSFRKPSSPPAAIMVPSALAAAVRNCVPA